jgi:Nif-specific regulatory protein
LRPQDRGHVVGCARVLEAYEWPGNVRELQNAIERAVVLGSREVIGVEDLPEQVLDCATPGTVATGTFHGALREQKAAMIVAAIEASGGNVTEAARRLKLNANYLHRLVNSLGLRDVIRKTSERPPDT